MIHKRKMNNCTTKLSILNINVNPAIIPMIDKYGPQATMLSFAFAFVLFYVSELNNRKKNQNLDNKEIQKKELEIKYLKQRVEHLEKINSMESEFTNVNQKIRKLEENLKKHMNSKTSEIIRKTKKNC